MLQIDCLLDESSLPFDSFLGSGNASIYGELRCCFDLLFSELSAVHSLSIEGHCWTLRLKWEYGLPCHLHEKPCITFKKAARTLDGVEECVGQVPPINFMPLLVSYRSPVSFEGFQSGTYKWMTV